jgi:hypothetical protein
MFPQPRRPGPAPTSPTVSAPAGGLRWLAPPLLAAAVLTAVQLLAAGWEHQPPPAGPVEVVEAFFAAVADRDVDRALEYVVSVPYGPEAALLRPEAIGGGWQLLEARQVGNVGTSYETWVQVTLGDGRSRATGWVEVVEATDGTGRWWLVDPLVTIEIGSVAPLTYLQLNDLVLPLADLYAADPLAAHARYRLLPGPYPFFGRLPGLATDPQPLRWLLPPADHNPDPVPVAVPPLQVPEPTLALVQQQVNALLDECAQFQTREPAGCPFAADLEVGNSDQNTVRLLRDIRWQMIDYPRAELVDPGGRDRELGLPVVLADPGRVRLTATGERDRGELVTVSVDCRVGGGPDPMRVVFDPDGQPRVYQPLVAGVGLVSAFPAIIESTCPPATGANR